MSWKFWTWFRGGTVLQPTDERAKNSRRKPAANRNSDSRESEDILTSISGIMEAIKVEDGAAERPARATESFRFTDVVLATDTVNSLEADNDTEEMDIRSDLNPAEASPSPQPVLAIQTAAEAPPASKVPEQREAPPTAKPQTPKPVRETTPPKRSDPPKEIMKTLVVEDGHWPMFKGVSGSFKDLDEADDADDSDQRSPFKTILPNDE